MPKPKQSARAPRFNVRISGQIEAATEEAAREALAKHLMKPDKVDSPLLEGGILRVLRDES